MRLIQALPFIGLATATVVKDPVQGLARRQVDVVKGVFEKVSSDTAAVGAAAKSFSGDPGPLTQASNTLLADLKTGASTISGSAEVDITGATQIAQFVTGLQSTVQQTIKDIISIKAQVSAIGQGGVVYASLVDQKAASQALADATTKKTPAALQSVASQLSAGIISAIDEGIAAYKEFEGQSAPSGGSAPAAPADAPAPASPTAPSVGGAPVAAPVASAPPKAAPVAATTPAECGPAAKTTPKVASKAVATTTTTKAPPPAAFTGAADAASPVMGLALAAAGLVAAL